MQMVRHGTQHRIETDFANQYAPVLLFSLKVYIVDHGNGAFKRIKYMPLNLQSMSPEHLQIACEHHFAEAMTLETWELAEFLEKVRGALGCEIFVEE